jgi:hypothetical protein
MIVSQNLKEVFQPGNPRYEQAVRDQRIDVLRVQLRAQVEAFNNNEGLIAPMPSLQESTVEETSTLGELETRLSYLIQRRCDLESWRDRNLTYLGISELDLDSVTQLALGLALRETDLEIETVRRQIFSQNTTKKPAIIWQ